MMLGCAELLEVSSAKRSRIAKSMVKLRRKAWAERIKFVRMLAESAVSCFKPGYSHHQVLLGECRDLTKRGN
ncbi:hypothetical protein HBI81_231980 [Parastagonospora nodorum]|nr:hypothetical protein HBH43_168850 [Parastagonospora nodorum]KAH5186354.1 hypothetical protein HBH68_165030 [Parastagonospora nodorum]KAH5248006.1 hypothetical protein HBI72_169500 [Parastagonospora nodorum]KAH5364136.1 hypothetical protein HBI33_188780 [Parastagonospora nodorum]KAH5595383.1 hypothetical protein HBI45_187090 [Parastagonospora nodorum]